jgi:hypothetical protein
LRVVLAIAFFLVALLIGLVRAHPDDLAFLQKYSPSRKELSPGYCDVFKITSSDPDRIVAEIRRALTTAGFESVGTTPGTQVQFKKGDRFVDVSWGLFGSISSREPGAKLGVDVSYDENDVVILVRGSPPWLTRQYLSAKQLLHL